MSRQGFFYLNEDDRNMLRTWWKEYEASKLKDSSATLDSRGAWCRVKPNTTVEPMKYDKTAGTLTPGVGKAIMWRPGVKIEGGEVVPYLRKSSASEGDTSKLGIDFAFDEDNDIVIDLYNFTPFEIFDSSWVKVENSRTGPYFVSSPPNVCFIGKATNGINAGKVKDCDIGWLDMDYLKDGSSCTPTYFKDEDNKVIKRPCAHPGPGNITAGALMLLNQSPNGNFVVVTAYC